MCPKVYFANICAEILFAETFSSDVSFFIRKLAGSSQKVKFWSEFCLIHLEISPLMINLKI